MSDHATTPVVALAPAVLDRWNFEMGVAALALRSRRDLLRVIDGGRRMLAEKTPRPVLDLKLIKSGDQSL
jgi:hypothetical protein